MAPESSFSIGQFSGFFWIGFLIFVVVAGVVSWALLYHWAKYKQIGDLVSRFTQGLFLLGIIFLIFLSFAFLINLK